MKRFFRYVLYVFVIIAVGIMCVIGCARFIIETKTPREAAPQTIQFIELENSEEIAYQEIDNQASTTIVFVGGLSGWSGTWARTVRALNESLLSRERLAMNTDTPGQTFNIITIDLPPFGFSIPHIDAATAISGTFFRDTQAQRLNQFREAKKLDHVIMVGHSYGGGVVAEAVMEHPEGVDKMIIIDGVLGIDEDKVVTHGIFTDHVFVTELFMNGATHFTGLIRSRLAAFVYKTEHINNDLARIYMQSFVVDGNGKKFALWLRDYLIDPLQYKSTSSEEYKKLTMPVRVIWGEKDTLTPIALGEYLMTLLPNAQLYRLTDVGHIPMIEDYEQSDTALLNSILK